MVIVATILSAVGLIVGCGGFVVMVVKIWREL